MLIEHLDRLGLVTPLFLERFLGHELVGLRQKPLAVAFAGTSQLICERGELLIVESSANLGRKKTNAIRRRELWLDRFGDRLQILEIVVHDQGRKPRVELRWNHFCELVEL